MKFLLPTRKVLPLVAATFEIIRSGVKGYLQVYTSEMRVSDAEDLIGRDKKI